MVDERILIRDAIGGFAPGQALRAALLLTYSFDGKWIEEGFVPDLFDRPVTTALLIRDANRIVSEAPTVRYHRVNAAFSTRVFHPKLGLFVAEDRALAVIGSANLTRGGLERNLELGSVFEISREGGPRQFFEDILHYISGPLMNELETGGSGATSMRDVAVALREVVADVPHTPNTAHAFLHNYERSLWEQLLNALPHRQIARLSIVSPFFEPNTVESEDPPGDADGGIFARIFEDLEFKPSKGEKLISVFFQQSEGKTLLPVDKLTRWKDKIALYQRRTTSDEPRPLHGKLLLIEGAREGRRDPFLFALHGSPNFTSAALLSRPPTGNAEIAVLTTLPQSRNGFARAEMAFGFGELFGKVVDWSTLTHVKPEPVSPAAPDIFRVTDVYFDVNKRRLELIWRGDTTAATGIRVLVESNGAWLVVATGVVGQEKRLSLDASQLVAADRDKLLSLRSTHVRVELLSPQDVVVASAVAPINVDCPHQFCGTVLVGPAMSTLDERIAVAGCGIPQTYRQQLDFIERQRSRKRDNGAAPTVLTHQADLDRFFRNLKTGFKGIRSHLRTLPNSEFTARRTLRDLIRWCQDAIDQEEGRLVLECRIFVVDRLVREIGATLESCEHSRILAPKARAIAGEYRLIETLDAGSQWLRALTDRHIQSYVAETLQLLASVRNRIRDMGGH